MKTISEAEITDALVAAALPAIVDFGKSHPNKRWAGFAVEVLSEMYYFHLCAEFEELCLDLDETRPSTGMAYLLPEDIDSNCQEWQNFDFARKNKEFARHWKPLQESLNAEAEQVKSLPEEQWSAAWTEIHNKFWRASRAAFARLVDSDTVRALPKASCFVTFIYEHHDVF